MKFIKSNIKALIGLILGLLLAGGITAFATTYFASDIQYKNGKNVAQALNELYDVSQLSTRINSLETQVANLNASTSNFATKTDLKNLNTHWTELASSNLRNVQSKSVSLDSYNQIAVTAWDGECMYECSIIPTELFKTFTSSSNPFCYYDVNHEDGDYYVEAYYNNSTLYYHLCTGPDSNTSQYVKVFGIN